MKRLKVVLLFMFAVLLIRCSKDTKQANTSNGELRAFIGSPVYRDFVNKNRPAGRLNVDAARIVRVDNRSAIVHIPVMERKKVAGAIIGMPTGGGGQYELLYQDNRQALSGTGKIYLYTSSNQLFGKIDLQQGKVRSFDTENALHLDLQQAGQARVDCGFFCRLSKCYTALKAQFPTDAVCELLDLFFGVCTSATITSCLIKMALK